MENTNFNICNIKEITVYEKLKEEMRSKYADDRMVYTNGKQDMINIIQQK